MIESNTKDPIQKLVFELGKLPGIGERTAGRLAYYIIRQNQSYALSLSDAILRAKQMTALCKTCFTLTEEEQCHLCNSESREKSIICVVEKPNDVLTIERSGSFKGTYHVLHGVLSPLDGVGPGELKIKELLDRIQAQPLVIHEIILATNPSVDGDVTANYLSKQIRALNIKVTRLAHGLPVGGVLEYTDQQTLDRAIKNRVEMME